MDFQVSKKKKRSVGAATSDSLLPAHYDRFPF